MGFGFLFLGYLVAFVLSLTLDRLGFGGAAYLFGYALMYKGLSELTRYQPNFVYGKWLTYPLLLISVYRLGLSFDVMFSWNSPIFAASVSGVVEWFSILLTLVFHAAFLYGIRMLAADVELLHIATKAIRNLVFLGMYGFLYAVTLLPASLVGSFVSYVSYAARIVWLVIIVCNLLLMVSCNKNICPAGDEDQPPRPSRFSFINRLNEVYDKNRQRTIDNAKHDAEEFVRRRREKQEQRQNKKKKKK